MGAMTATLSCPHCTGKALFEGKRGNVSLHGCGACGGLWIGNELAGRLVQQLEPDAMKLADLASKHAAPFPEVASQPTCPVCQIDLRRITLAGTAIALDLCDAHGTWFDREELQSVARFLDERRRATAAPFPEPLRFDVSQYPSTNRNVSYSASVIGIAGDAAGEVVTETIGFAFGTVIESIFD